MYSGEYDACDVTLSVYTPQTSLKNMPDHGGNRTLIDNIDIEGTRFCCEISHTRTAQTAKLSWQSIGLVFQRSYVRFPPWSGIFFKLARCEYTLRVTSQASLS